MNSERDVRFEIRWLGSSETRCTLTLSGLIALHWFNDMLIKPKAVYSAAPCFMVLGDASDECRETWLLSYREQLHWRRDESLKGVWYDSADSEEAEKHPCILTVVAGSTQTSWDEQWSSKTKPVHLRGELQAERDRRGRKCDNMNEKCVQTLQQGLWLAETHNSWNTKGWEKTRKQTVLI